jgi:hypothetical protein
MPCRDCLHFLPSEKANQRAFLEGYGYCKAGETPLLRARFFADSRDCWLDPQRYHQERHP